MSKTENEKREAGQSAKKQNGGQPAEKIVTRYDRRMQRREEEKKKELRDKRVGRIAGIVLIAALVCVAASFPIRTWVNLNGTYIEVNGEKITKVEYDYNYNLVVNNFRDQYYTTYLYYFGIDLSGDLSQQMYSDTLTWKDYFDELTVERLAQNKAMVKEAQGAGFVHDTAQEYDEYRESLKDAAASAGTSVKDYVSQMYGAYATESRVKPYVEEGLYLTAYSEEVLEDRFAPSAEEIQEYYEADKASYDSVDYYLYTVDAELPTEPTELADPVEEDKEGGDEDGAETDGAESDGTETPYQPSEAEIAAAMEAAKAEADAVQKKIKTEGELNTNMKKSSVTYALQSWLFDDERKAGDTTVIEDSSGHRYYVLGFEDRYLDKIRSADARILILQEGDGQAILDEWKSGAATEESFGELCDKYKDSAQSTVEGGLYEALVSASTPEKVREWVFDSSRKTGDTTVISGEEGEYSYVIYYVAPNDEEWYLSIRQTLLSQQMSEYLESLTENMDLKDRGNLNYIKVQEEAAAASDQQGQEGSEDGSEEGSDGGSQESAGEGAEDGSQEGSEN